MMTSGNEAGVMLVPVPLEPDDPRRLLAKVAAATAQAKSTQLAEVARGLMVFLAETRITRLYIRHQHMLNVLTTNLPGPPVPLYLAGARVSDPVALAPLAGNVTASFAALSYAGGLTLSVIADGASWPDLDVLTNSMRSAWEELRGAVVPELRETIGTAGRLAAP